jgi:hypothetical protein
MRKVVVMGWLAKIPFGRGGTAVAEAEPEDAGSTSETTGPALMVLVNDASGMASFKTHEFEDVESATEFVRYWFPMEAEDGLTAFWAMTEQPEGGTDSGAEPLVMIRDTSRDGVVYLFSFVNLESAQTFLREEEARGTNPDAMLFYWAVQVKREIDRWGKLILTPSTPPGVAAYEREGETPESDGWVVREELVAERAPAKPTEDARPLMEEAPNARTGVADPYSPGQETFELTSWMERARKSPPRQRDVVEAAAEVIAASKESFEPPFAAEAEPETGFEDEAGVEASFEEAEPDLLVEYEPVDEAIYASEPVVVTVEVVETAEPAMVSETPAFVEEPEATAASIEVVAEAPELSEPEMQVEIAAVEEAVAEAENYALTETVSETETTDVSEGPLRVRASTNGNGHKSPGAHEVIVEINGHQADHEAPAELTDSESPATDELHPAREERVPSMNGNGIANGHAPHVTSPQGEGTPAGERPPHQSVAGTSETDDQAPEVVHDVRIEAATTGRGDEKISIQIGIHLQSRALKVRRWEVKEEPFEGFKSPPGRF